MSLDLKRWSVHVSNFLGFIFKKRTRPLRMKFQADHPFIVAIIVDENKNALFLGRVKEPWEDILVWWAY